MGPRLPALVTWENLMRSPWHIEPIGYWHIAHSYVRGNWKKEEDSSAILLAKSCHDLDILTHWIGKRCSRVSSFGSLGHFKKENQPKGATDHCFDCPTHIESNCSYSAKKIYLRDFRGNEGWPNSIVSLDTSPEGMAKALREGPYGKCVFASDNDVVDRQVVNMEYENGVVVSFTMSGFTISGHRETWIMGTEGQLRGHGDKLIYTDFKNDKSEDIPINAPGDPSEATGHAGDSEIIQGLITAVAENDDAYLETTPKISLESHLIAFAAEKARKNGTVENIVL